MCLELVAEDLGVDCAGLFAGVVSVLVVRSGDGTSRDCWDVPMSDGAFGTDRLGGGGFPSVIVFIAACMMREPVLAEMSWSAMDVESISSSGGSSPPLRIERFGVEQPLGIVQMGSVLKKSSSNRELESSCSMGRES